MGDRVRIGELLTVFGTIGLLAALAFTKWFNSQVQATAARGTLTGKVQGHLLSPAGNLGWLAFAILLFALVACIVFLLRVLTASGPERPMLQAPVAFVLSALALLTLIVRLFIFRAGLTDSDIAGSLPKGVRVVTSQIDTTLHGGAWLGLASVVLMMLGTWTAMADERTGSAAAKRRTQALLANVRVRTVPHVPAPPGPEAEAVARDPFGTEPTPSSAPEGS